MLSNSSELGAAACPQIARPMFAAPAWSGVIRERSIPAPKFGAPGTALSTPAPRQMAIAGNAGVAVDVCASANGNADTGATGPAAFDEAPPE